MPSELMKSGVNITVMFDPVFPTKGSGKSHWAEVCLGKQKRAMSKV